jgi:hypothetical protein
MSCHDTSKELGERVGECLDRLILELEPDARRLRESPRRSESPESLGLVEALTPDRDRCQPEEGGDQ